MNVYIRLRWLQWKFLISLWLRDSLFRGRIYGSLVARVHNNRTHIYTIGTQRTSIDVLLDDIDMLLDTYQVTYRYRVILISTHRYVSLDITMTRINKKALRRT